MTVLSASCVSLGLVLGPAPVLALASQAPATPFGLDTAGFWILVLCALLLAAATTALWLLVIRAKDLSESADRWSALDKIHSQLGKLVGERSDIDLRRLEHVLLDVRDGLKKVEGAFLDSVQQGRSPDGGTAAGAGGPREISERVVNRLLALGYERVELAAEDEQLAAVAGGDGAVLVEAQRGGSLYKGRVHFENGAIRDVDMRSSHSTFP